MSQDLQQTQIHINSVDIRLEQPQKSRNPLQVQSPLLSSQPPPNHISRVPVGYPQTAYVNPQYQYAFQNGMNGIMSGPLAQNPNNPRQQIIEQLIDQRGAPIGCQISSNGQGNSEYEQTPYLFKQILNPSSPSPLPFNQNLVIQSPFYNQRNGYNFNRSQNNYNPMNGYNYNNSNGSHNTQVNYSNMNGNNLNYSNNNGSNQIDPYNNTSYANYNNPPIKTQQQNNGGLNNQRQQASKSSYNSPQLTCQSNPAFSELDNYNQAPNIYQSSNSYQDPKFNNNNQPNSQNQCKPDRTRSKLNENNKFDQDSLSDNEDSQQLAIDGKDNVQELKVYPCQRKDKHDRKKCQYYHNDDDRRRNPDKYKYSFNSCSPKGVACLLKEDCPQAHNKVEQLYHPLRYKAKFCKDFKEKYQCSYGDFCSFAHCDSEIVIPMISKLKQDEIFFMYFYKTVWCPNTSNHGRGECPYMHNVQDFRRDPKRQKLEPKQCEEWKIDYIHTYSDGQCPKQLNCKNCHGWKEYNYHPQVYKTKPCNIHNCKQIAECPMYHSNENKRIVTLALLAEEEKMSNQILSTLLKQLHLFITQGKSIVFSSVKTNYDVHLGAPFDVFFSERELKKSQGNIQQHGVQSNYNQGNKNNNSNYNGGRLKSQTMNGYSNGNNSNHNPQNFSSSNHSNSYHKNGLPQFQYQQQQQQQMQQQQQQQHSNYQQKHKTNRAQQHKGNQQQQQQQQQQQYQVVQNNLNNSNQQQVQQSKFNEPIEQFEDKTTSSSKNESEICFKSPILAPLPKQKDISQLVSSQNFAVSTNYLTQKDEELSNLSVFKSLSAVEPNSKNGTTNSSYQLQEKLFGSQTNSLDQSNDNFFEGYCIPNGSGCTCRFGNFSRDPCSSCQIQMAQLFSPSSDNQHFAEAQSGLSQTESSKASSSQAISRDSSVGEDDSSTNTVRNRPISTENPVFSSFNGSHIRTQLPPQSLQRLEKVSSFNSSLQDDKLAQKQGSSYSSIKTLFCSSDQKGSPELYSILINQGFSEDSIKNLQSSDIQKLSFLDSNQKKNLESVLNQLEFQGIQDICNTINLQNFFNKE